MPAGPSVHDNFLVAYTVTAKEKKIVLQTEYLDDEPNERTDVVFEEVLAYHFENDLFCNILFDIEEMEVSSLLEQEAKRFEDGWRYGWPVGWDKEKENIGAYISRLGMRAFKVSSSYGLDGWVLARTMKLISRG